MRSTEKITIRMPPATIGMKSKAPDMPRLGSLLPAVFAASCQPYQIMPAPKLVTKKSETENSTSLARCGSR